MASYLGFAVILVILPLLHCQSSDDTLTVVPMVREIFMENGVEQYLNCSSRSSHSAAKLKWELPQDTLHVERTEAKASSGDKLNYEHNILIPSFAPEYAGKYVCTLSKNGSVQRSHDIVLTAITETKIEPKFEFGNDTATLGCNISIPSAPGRTITGPTWLKNKTEISELKDEKRFTAFPENNTLLITSPTRDDAGLYVARFEIDGAEKPYDCHVALYAAPLVLDFDKSKNLIQEDNMELQCKVKGYPRAHVTWYKDETLIDPSEDERIEQTPINGYENARLTIKNVEFSDAGEYKCLANASGETNAKTITVRVKDKLAALWPFLGILGEVIVLCTIIFIYEKRRNKQAEQADNDAQEADHAEKKGNVRNRRNQK